jgi:hypothetical protein
LHYDGKKTEHGCHTEIINVENPNFVSWQFADSSERKAWEPRGIQSVCFRKMGSVSNNFSFDQALVAKLTVGMVSKENRWLFKTDLQPYALPLVYHLVLPELHLPEENRFLLEPKSVRKFGKQIALTGAFEDKIEIKFVYKQVTAKQFEEFKGSGDPDFMRVSPEFKESVMKYVKATNEEVKDVAASTIAKTLSTIRES